jgi:hypothetical protein
VIDVQVRKDDDVDVVGRHPCAPKLGGQPPLPFREELPRCRPDAGVDEHRLRTRPNEEGAEGQQPAVAVEQLVVAAAGDGFDFVRGVRERLLERGERRFRVAEDLNRDAAEIHWRRHQALLWPSFLGARREC